MECLLPWHRGNKRVFKVRIVYKDDERFEGCMACTDGLLTCLFSTDKRITSMPGTDKTYKISAAHRRDIKMRRCAPDLSHVWYDRKGLGAACRFQPDPACVPAGLSIDPARLAKAQRLVKISDSRREQR